MNKALKKSVSFILLAVFSLAVLAGGINLGLNSSPVKAVNETIGYTTDGTQSDEVAGNYYNALRYQASTNMTVNQMKIKISVAGTGKMKCAIYSDNSGSIGSFLKGTNELSNLGTGWQTFTLTSSQALTSGTYYWLVSWRDGIYSIAADSATGVNYYAPLTYAASWPTNLPAYQGIADFRHSFYAIAAATATPTPVPTSTPTNTPTPIPTNTPTPPPAGTIGYTTDGASSDGVAGNYYNAIRYQASSNMTVNQMRIKIAATGTGKIKCAIYSDNAGNPGSFLMGTVELSNAPVGWNTLNLTSSLSLTSGSYYWLASWRDTSVYSIAADSATGVNWYAPLTYTTSWPTNLPAKQGQADWRHSFYATSGATPTPAPTATNTPTPRPTNTPTPTATLTPTPAPAVIGYTADGTLTDGVANNYYNAIRYQASSNMTVTVMKLKIATAGTGKMKCAIYSDNAGSIGSFLKGTNELVGLGTGWWTFGLTSSQALTSGTYYWLVSWRDGDYGIAADSATGVNYWGALTYASSWPTNLPASGGQADYRHSFYATNGATPTPKPTPTAGPTATPTATPNATATPTPPPSGNTISIDRATKYQTMEGFGFFGGRGAWWDSSDSAHFYSDTWADLMFNNLGATMWRDELYPHNPVTATGGQDADLSKQMPVHTSVKNYCSARNIPLKQILTIWSPPVDFKCTIDGSDNFQIGSRPPDTKGGNVLDPNQVTNYTNWLKSGLQEYKNNGLNIYAMSFQNEPFFWEPYNSCYYYVDRSSSPHTDHYDYHTFSRTINAGIRSFTNNDGSKVLTYGTENMLSIEASADNVQWFYHNYIMNDSTALANLDRWALHGYTDGINSQDPASALDCWQRHYSTFGQPSGKPTWQTEISGFDPVQWNDYTDGSGTLKHGGFSLGMSIQVALAYGKVAAWVYWQGTDSTLNEYTLSDWNLNVGKAFYASKQFYRFIRPGSKMVKVTNSDSSLVVTAFENTTLNNFVVVLCNDSTSAKTINLTGSNVPASFTGYQTTSSDNCRNIGAVSASSVTIPAKGILTLVNGSYTE